MLHLRETDFVQSSVVRQRPLRLRDRQRRKVVCHRELEHLNLFYLASPSDCYLQNSTSLSQNKFKRVLENKILDILTYSFKQLDKPCKRDSFFEGLKW